jgi:AbrB family transcriptional regulator (stage V sporulation protein T)
MSGIVRKIDDLGRIVIPKELRKSLNIKNSDDLEITITDDKIILEKYYRLKNLKKTLNKYFKMLDKFLDSDFIISDKENILLTSKEYSDLKDTKLSNKIIELLDYRKPVLENSFTSLKLTSDIELNKNYYFYPIIIDTDILGSIIIFNNKKIESKDILVVDIFSYLLKEKIE